MKGPNGLPGGRFSSNRAAYIDLSRGLLIVLMMLVHATIACTESVRQQIQYIWLLDIASTGFTTLACYTIGMRYAGVGVRPRASQLFVRAFQVLVVMFYSNLLLQLGKLFVEDQLLATISLSWLIGLFTLATPYDISGVLLPIALSLPLCALLYWTERRWGNWMYLLWILLTVALVFIGTQIVPVTPTAGKLYNLLWREGLGGFAILPFIGYGVLGFVTARLFAQQPVSATVTFRASAIIGLGIVAMWNHQFLTSAARAFYQGERVIGLYAMAELEFLAVLASGILLAWLVQRDVINAVPRLLMTLGRYGLFAFVIHRVFGHVLALGLGLKDGRYGMYFFMFVSILGLTYLACLGRMRWAALDHALVRIYL